VDEKALCWTGQRILEDPCWCGKLLGGKNVGSGSFGFPRRNLNQGLDYGQRIVLKHGGFAPGTRRNEARQEAG